MSKFLTPHPFVPQIYPITDPKGYLKHLEDFGYVVIKALDDHVVDALEDTFWEEVAGLGWIRDFPKSWEASRDKFTMGCSDKCGHFMGWDWSRTVFEVYKQTAIQEIYSNVMKNFNRELTSEQSKDLLRGLTSLNVFRPHGHKADWKTMSTPWYHVDSQDPCGTKRSSFNSILNLKDVAADTGGFVVVPKSHLMYSEGLRRPEERTQANPYLDLMPYTNYIKSPANLITGNTDHTQPILVCTGGVRGTLTVFDPRLVHCSTASLIASERQTGDELLRLACFVSMVPRIWASEETLKKRIELLADRICLNSHVVQEIQVGRRNPSIMFYDEVYADEAAMSLM